MSHVVFMVERGHTWEFVLDLPIPAFDTLFMACFKRQRIEQYEALMDSAIATHGLTKEMEKREKALKELDKDDDQPADDQDKFVAKFGSSF